MDYRILLLLCELVMWYYQSGLNKGLLFHSMHFWVSFQEMSSNIQSSVPTKMNSLSKDNFGSWMNGVDS